MKSIRTRRLALVITLVLGVATASLCILLALQNNINLFYTPSQVMAGAVPPNQIIRIGGTVVKHSIRRHPRSLQVTFVITDQHQAVTVYYNGILPDLFREGQGVVVQGKLKDPQHFIATQVLAKHDETYMPPAIDKAIKMANTQQDVH